MCGALFRVEPQRAAPGRTCGHCGAPAPPDARACAHCGVALESSLCPSCFARSPRGARHCSACGLLLACQALRALPGEAHCPRCRGELGLRVVEGSPPLVECTACTGLWIEPATFDTLCRRAAESAPSPAPAPLLGPGRESYVPCVTCGELMVRRRFLWGGKPAPIVLDFCRSHGVWLDADELPAVVAVVRARGAAREEPAALGPAVEGLLRSELPALRTHKKGFFDRLSEWIEAGLEL